MILLTRNDLVMFLSSKKKFLNNLHAQCKIIRKRASIDEGSDLVHRKRLFTFLPLVVVVALTTFLYEHHSNISIAVVPKL
jgi:hypothetical protein